MPLASERGIESRARLRNIAGELTLDAKNKILSSFGERINLANGCGLVLPDGTELSGQYPARTKTSKDKVRLDSDVEIPLPTGCVVKLPEGCALAVKKGAVINRPRPGVAEIAINSPDVASRPGQALGLRLPGGSLDQSFRQFARTPFMISIQSGWLKIVLCTVHIYFGDNSDERLLARRKREIQALTKALARRAARESGNDRERQTFVGVLGDFNIISKEHETMAALEENGFVVPESLKEIPGSNVKKDKAYDQIAFWKPDIDRGYASLDIIGSGVFDFFEHVFRTEDEDNYKDAMGTTRTSYGTWRTYKMSDHLPMWIEQRSDFADEYLEACLNPND